MLQRNRCVPFRRAAYVGGGIKMRLFVNELDVDDRERIRADGVVN